jgi:mono/diheme cytochrome c family protein
VTETNEKKIMRLCTGVIAAIAMVAGSALADDTTPGTAVPTFNGDIAPILYQNCSNCHRPGEVAPFALLTYQDAAKRAKQIAQITQARVMPPWKATPGYGDFLDVRRLTEQQIATIKNWAEHDSPEGDVAGSRLLRNFPTDGWRGSRTRCSR